MERFAKLSGPELSAELISFLSHFECHEDVEEEVLFPRIQSIRGSGDEPLDFDYERDHTELWRRLSLLQRASEQGSETLKRESIGEFERYAVAHMRCEEEILFPLVARAIPLTELERLGLEAERRSPWRSILQ